MNNTDKAEATRQRFMKRYGAWQAAIVLAAVICLPGCKGLWNDLFGSRQQASTTISNGKANCLAGLSDEQKQARADSLTALLTTPSSCQVSTQCPAGSFCNVERGSVCDWECMVDSDCGGGERICLCNGKCTDGGGVPDAGTMVDPACPKNLTLIRSMNPTDGGVPDVGASGVALGPRSCAYSDLCPNGTYCDRRVGECRYDCLKDEDCPGVNGANGTCDCFGRCGAVAVPSQTLPILEVSPASITTEKPTTENAPSFRLRLNARYGSLEAPSMFPIVAATASKGLRVQCPPNYETAQSCAIDGSSWAPSTQARYSREINVITIPDEWVSPTTTTGATGYSVRLTSAATANQEVVVPFYELGSPPIDGWQDVDSSTVRVKSAGFRGTVAIKDTTTSGTFSMTLPVFAKSYFGDISVGGVDVMIIYDRTRTISPTGTLIIHADSQTRYSRWINASDQPNFAANAMDAAVTVSSLQTRDSGRSVRSRFAVSPYLSTMSGVAYQADLLLTEDKDMKTCDSSPGLCSAGYKCVYSFCIPEGTDTTSFWLPFPSTAALQNRQEAAWMTSDDSGQHPSVRALLDHPYTAPAGQSHLPRSWRRRQNL